MPQDKPSAAYSDEGFWRKVRGEHVAQARATLAQWLPPMQDGRYPN